MYARIATHTFAHPAEAEAAERNLRERLVPALERQPGFRGAFFGRTPDGAGGLSVSLFADAATARAAGVAINAAPLLDGQDPALLPAPVAVYGCTVLSDDPGTAPARVARLGDLGPSAEEEVADDQRWATAEFAPFLRTLPGLAHAYLAQDDDTRHRLSLTVWESDEAVEASGQAIGAWSRGQVAAGRRPALAPQRVWAYEVFLHAAPPTMSAAAAGA